MTKATEVGHSWFRYYIPERRAYVGDLRTKGYQWVWATDSLVCGIIQVYGVQRRMRLDYAVPPGVARRNSV